MQLRPLLSLPVARARLGFAAAVVLVPGGFILLRGAAGAAALGAGAQAQQQHEQKQKRRGFPHGRYFTQS
jgi:hypothetical protein